MASYEEFMTQRPLGSQHLNESADFVPFAAAEIPIRLYIYIYIYISCQACLSRSTDALTRLPDMLAA